MATAVNRVAVLSKQAAGVAAVLGVVSAVITGCAGPPPGPAAPGGPTAPSNPAAPAGPATPVQQAAPAGPATPVQSCKIAVHARVPSPAARITFSAARNAGRAVLSRDAQIIGQRASHLCIPVKVAVASSSAIDLTGPRADEAQLKALAVVVGALQFRQVLLQGPAAVGTADVNGSLGTVSAAVRTRYGHLNCGNPAWQQQLLASQGATPPAGAQIVSCARNDSTKYALSAAATLRSPRR
jgi:hypothetical protein